MERLSITPNTTFEFALWCKLLRDRGFTGMQVARQLGKSEGYVNNLVRILERASLPILQRWCDEQRPNSGHLHVCATDWLMQVCILPHAEQDVQLADRIAKLSRPPANGEVPVPRTRPPSNPPANAPNGHATNAAANGHATNAAANGHATNAAANGHATQRTPPQRPSTDHGNAVARSTTVDAPDPPAIMANDNALPKS